MSTMLWFAPKDGTQIKAISLRPQYRGHPRSFSADYGLTTASAEHATSA